MALDVSALSTYVEQNELPLVTKSLFSAKTASLLTLQTGIKYQEAINILETDAIFQDGSGCGFSSSGTTRISQRILTVGQIKVNESICPKQLNKYYVQKELKKGSLPENEQVPFEEEYSGEKAGKIAEQLENSIWQGDTTSGDANLKRFDGFLKIMDAAGDYVSATSQASITSANIFSILDDFYAKIPAALIDKEDFRAFCGWDTFRMLMSAIRTANLYHYNTDDAVQKGEIVVPGTNIKLVAVHGLDSTNRIVGARLSNLYYGVDMENEEERFEIFYAREADEVRYVAEFKAGVQVAFTSEIVMYKNS
jgi:hypothetical protein